ncbi:MAG: SIR2 family protein, partial [Myxococcota bacterium]
MSSAIEEIKNLPHPPVLYVGEAVPRDAGLPSADALIEQLLKAAGDYDLSEAQAARLRKRAAQGEQPYVFGEVERVLTKQTFGSIVERTLDDKGAEVPPLATAVASLAPKLRGVITPNLDHLLERAFRGELTVYPRPTGDLASRSGWLLKLHGTLRDRETWVLTKEQQASALYRDAVHREVFSSLFLSHPILFVGTSMDDPVLRALVDQIQALVRGQRPRHFAIVEPEEATGDYRRELAEAGIELIPCPAAEVPALLAQLAGEVANDDAASPSRPPPSPAPAAPAPSPPAAAQGAAPPPAEDGALHVLFLAANPQGTDPLRLDRELRLIREAIDRSRRGRQEIKVEIRTAATVHDLRRALLEQRFDLVHVSGHGEQDGLVLEDEQGECVTVGRQAVARLFARYAPPNGALRCV